MDFLDPVAKKRRGHRLMIGYVLTAILILTATTIITYWSYGFDVDRKTGEVIQNGLVYIDSAPEGARIELRSGQNYQEATTNSKLALPEGVYDVVIKRDGYRDWKRSVEVKGGSIYRLTYPLLVAQNISEDFIGEVGTEVPLLTTQSPDRKWLLISQSGSFRDFVQFNLGDIQADGIRPVSSPIVFPVGVFKPADGAVKLEVIEWSTDNQNFLVKYTYGTGYEFLVLNRDEPEKSVNINQLLGVNPVSVTLRDKKPDMWYLHDPATGVLQMADSTKNVVELLTGVFNYKSHGEDILLYTQRSSDSAQQVMIKDNDQTYALATLPIGVTYLDVARFQRNWYFVVGSQADKKTYIYKNPVEKLALQPKDRIAPISILRSGEPIDRVEFSTNTRFIMASGGQALGIYDVERDESYRIALSEALDPGTAPDWMDGHRILYKNGGVNRIFDFDGSNNQPLVTGMSADAVFFDRDYKVIYTLKRDGDTGPIRLFVAGLRLKADR